MSSFGVFIYIYKYLYIYIIHSPYYILSMAKRRQHKISASWINLSLPALHWHIDKIINSTWTRNTWHLIGLNFSQWDAFAPLQSGQGLVAMTTRVYHKFTPRGVVTAASNKSVRQCVNAGRLRFIHDDTHFTHNTVAIWQDYQTFFC